MKLRFALPALLALLLLAACGRSDTPSVSTVASAPAGPAPHSAGPRVGLVMKTLTNPFFVEMEKGARRAERELGLTLLVRTAAQETSVEQQAQLLEDLIAERVDAIVLAPADSQRLVATVKKAVEAGIKVVNIDNRLDPAELQQRGLAPIPFVSVDNEAGAYQAGRYLAAQAGGPAQAQAAILEGIRSADNARQRRDGARRGLRENKAVTLVASESANWKIDEAYTVTRKLFAAHPHVSLIFAANDMMALGALKYLRESGRGDVRIVGYDALDEAKAEIKAGGLLATVDQQAAEQGYQGVVLAQRLIKGESVPPLTLIETRLITADTLR